RWTSGGLTGTFGELEDCRPIEWDILRTDGHFRNVGELPVQSKAKRGDDRRSPEPIGETTALTQGLGRIPEQLGYLVIRDGAVLGDRPLTLCLPTCPPQSSGDLENDERAATVLELVATASRLQVQCGHEPPFKHLSGEGGGTDPPKCLWGGSVPSVPAVVLGEHLLLVTVSGQKLFVVKRQNHVQEPDTV
ncbi:LOW QUALITY PROTEIN: ragulator complex protein LAMTOR4, partial [Pterocles gutturalis]